MRHSFTAGEVVRLSGVPFSTLNAWDRDGFLTPSILSADGKGSDRLWSLADVVLARAIGEWGRTPRTAFAPLVAFLQHCPEPWPAYVVLIGGVAHPAATPEEAAAIAWDSRTCWVFDIGEARRRVLEGMEALAR